MQETWMINPQKLYESAEILTHMTIGLWKSLLIIAADEWRKSTEIQRQIFTKI